MKKVLAVLALGGVALALFLALQRRSGSETPAPAASQLSAPSVGVTAAAQSIPAAPSGPLPPAPMTDEAACARLSDLCSTSDKAVSAADCEKKLADARKMSGDGNVQRSEQCLADAKTCAAASGCISGGVGMGAMGEFLKGLGSALSH